MFLDEARVYVKGGDGGNGVIAFRREKYVPEGGPAGGDGGRGGNVILEADEGMHTLIDFRYKRHYKAARGQHGQGKNMHGARGQDLLLRVPVGTVIKDSESGEFIADLTAHGQQALVAKGGHGGRGNARFSTSANRAPTIAENGAPGGERWLSMELRLLADVGLVGFPNAGKSTLISRISAARPKIADYPFTTLTPNLGVVRSGDNDSFVVADIPGLIGGAHEGAGLGHGFLRHIERTRVLLFVLDAAETDGRDVLEDYETLRSELGSHDPQLLLRPFLIAANKMDLPRAQENLPRLRKAFGDGLICISAVTGQGLSRLIERVYRLLEEAPADREGEPEEAVATRFKEEDPFAITIADGVYVVSGPRIERLLAMTNFSTDEGLHRFQRTIKRMGLEDALKAQGIKEGDTVRIQDMEFDYSE